MFVCITTSIFEFPFSDRKIRFRLPTKESKGALSNLQTASGRFYVPPTAKIRHRMAADVAGESAEDLISPAVADYPPPGPGKHPRGAGGRRQPRMGSRPRPAPLRSQPGGQFRHSPLLRFSYRSICASAVFVDDSFAPVRSCAPREEFPPRSRVVTSGLSRPAVLPISLRTNWRRS